MYVRESSTRVGGAPAGPGLGGQSSDLENARAIARRIFDTYDRDRSGVIEPYEIGAMMTDAYKTINKAFSPSKADIDSYIRVLDRNGDGKVTLSDIEQIVIRFLLGEDYARTAPREVNTRPVYSPEVQARLDQARRIFQRYDRDGSGYIDENEVPQMMIDTYKAMGVNYIPTQADVDSYMRMADTNRDGRISLAEYETLVLRSLQARGIKFD
eukprot:TRINITY_DN5569_c0_g1_i1.p1 TRINITY_DN5569_c0_g1~~TRINITY_DN5569_c0_g1_i1.p1  ORF type:complete len:212 (-),score=54.47 TRINITY_DN5569_c0_g1_i1:80-715(-)